MEAAATIPGRLERAVLETEAAALSQPPTPPPARRPQNARGRGWRLMRGWGAAGGP
jgi:hypothetical protein